MIKEACGVAGAVCRNPDAAKLVYYCLYALQHRGQESCGIAVNRDGAMTVEKGCGLLHDVFDEKTVDSLESKAAIGHVRYSTAGGSGIANAQPLSGHFASGEIAVAHNGNLYNVDELRDELLCGGVIFQSTADSEIIMHMLARELLKCGAVEQALVSIMPRLKGSYSLVILAGERVIACRDVEGMRPLCIGRLGDDVIFASESCAFDSIGAEFIRDVRPGEVVSAENGEIKSFGENIGQKGHVCIFEYLYFARPDSVIDGISVHEARKHAGRILADEFPVEADYVIGVPDSGIDAAIGYSERSGIDFETGLVINRYVGRTFIQPTQLQRTSAVQMKIHVLKEVVAGKRIVLVDDSIVRGNTCANLTSMLRDAGAKEIHMRISAPEFLWPCYFGTDIPSKENLIACSYTREQIRDMIGADSLGFMPVKRLGEIVAGREIGYCDGCFSGDYPY